MVTYYLDLDELAQSAVTALQACPYTLPKLSGLEGAQNKQWNMAVKLGKKLTMLSNRWPKKLSSDVPM